MELKSVICAVAILSLLHQASSGDQTIQAVPIQKGEMTLHAFLGLLSPRYQVMFTIESGQLDDPLGESVTISQPTYGLESALLALRHSTKTVDGKAHPYVSIKDKLKPNIIHIVDQDLANSKTYALGANLGPVTFSGDINLKFGEKLLGLEKITLKKYVPGAGIFCEYLDDDRRVISIEAQGVSTREVLTDFINPERYHFIPQRFINYAGRKREMAA